MYIKNIIIFLVVFFIILWLQHNDDKKFDKVDKRISLYDKVKIPLISAILVILFKEMFLEKCENIFSLLMVKKIESSNNFDKKPTNFDNEPTNFDNEPTNFDNEPTNCENINDQFNPFEKTQKKIFNDIYIGPANF